MKEVPGIKRGTKEWLFAMRTYYADDPDVIALCELLEDAWDKERALGASLKGDINGEEGTAEDDEWSSGG
jgi:predicted Zn-dependent protease